MANLSKFGVPIPGASNVIMMPKLLYRFRVIMVGFGGVASQELSQNVISVTRPTVTHENIILDAYNSRANIPGKHTWEPLTLTVRDDMNNTASKSIAAQMQKQLSHGTQSSWASAGDFKFGMRIEQLDGSNEASSTPVETWTLAGCYISSAVYNENNYADSNFLQIALTIYYDNADIHGTGTVNGVQTDGALTIGNSMVPQTFSNALQGSNGNT